MPPARRRRYSSSSLGSGEPLRGREVDEPRTPQSLHPASPSSSSCTNTTTPSGYCITGSAAPRSPVRGNPAQQLRGATSRDRAGDPRRRPLDLRRRRGRPPPCRATPTAPAASLLLGSTLCTRRDPAFPHPPAAGAAAGGGGNGRIAVLLL